MQSLRRGGEDRFSLYQQGGSARVPVKPSAMKRWQHHSEAGAGRRADDRIWHRAGATFQDYQRRRRCSIVSLISEPKPITSSKPVPAAHAYICRNN
jgi:hypothetical protein